MGAHAPSPSPVPALRYPDAWRAPANPAGRAAAAAATDALASVGLLDAPAAQRALAASAPSLLGALPFPHANERVLTTITTLFLAWALYDDAIERSGEPDPRAVDAVRGQLGSAEGSAPFPAVFARVGEGLRTRSAAWRDRFARLFDETTASVREEARLTREHARTGSPPPVARYLAWRRVNIGVQPLLALVEHELDDELPVDVLADPLFEAYADAAADVFLSVNDLHSAKKDTGGLNFVTCHAAEHAVEADEARRALLSFHDEAVARIRVIGSALMHRHGGDARLRAWLAHAAYLLAGFAAWHAVAPRYA